MWFIRFLMYIFGMDHFTNTHKFFRFFEFDLATVSDWAKSKNSKPELK